MQEPFLTKTDLPTVSAASSLPWHGIICHQPLASQLIIQDLSYHGGEQQLSSLE